MIRRLGAGGTASVYLTEDQLLGRPVAVKRVHGAEVTPATAQRLQREARIMASLRHPNLVAIYDMLTDEDDLLLAMEYVDGGTLADLMADAPLDPPRVLELLRPIAEVLDHVHAEGVVHRDLKPSNVLVGRDGTVKLTDLGLATAAEITRITPPGSIVGTPSYMAPEQARAVPCTGAVDIFALATIAFQALSGRLPREGGTVISVLAQATSAPVPDLRELRPGTPPQVADALMRGMAADPEERPSACELLQALEDGFAPAEREPRPEPRPATRPRRPASRRRARLLALTALLLGVAAVIAVVELARGGGEPTHTAGGGRSTPTATATETATKTATPTATPRARTLSPVASVRAFYERAAAGDFAGAWRLAGPKMRAAFGGSRDRFEAEMSSLKRIDFQRLAVTQRSDSLVTVDIVSTATHTDHVDHCTGTLSAVKAGSRWVVEPAGVSCTR
jgi:eukaryotic-like serine/threonine-protein kinase